MNVNTNKVIFNDIDKLSVKEFSFSEKGINSLDKNKEKFLQKALIGLGIASSAALAVAGVICLKNKKPSQITLSDIKFDKGLATLKKTGEKFSGTIVHKTKDNSTVSLTYLDSVLQEAKKVNADDTIAYVKKYVTDGDKKVTSIFKPKVDGGLEEVRTLIRKNDSIRINGKNGFIEKYFQKAAGKWHRVDQFLDKNNPNSCWNPNRYNSGSNYYLQSGMDVNRFLRSGEFCNHQFTDKKIPLEIPADLPAGYKKAFEARIQEAKSDNRAVVDMLETLDEFSKSYTLETPKIVYRDAPSSWKRTVKEGILSDDAFVSTSIEKGASMEGIIGSYSQPYSCYKIHLPAGTKCANLTYTSEKEILLPRNAKFKVIGPDELEYILP